MTFDRFLQEAALLEGLVWRKYRRRSARHRVELRIKELGLDGFDAYLDLLRCDPKERTGLADLMRVTTNTDAACHPFRPSRRRIYLVTLRV